MTNRKEVFCAEEMVYFSPDATDPIVSIDSSKVYVIGGLVDRSISKVGPRKRRVMDRTSRTTERRSWAFLLCVCLWPSTILSASIEVIMDDAMNGSDEHQHARRDDHCF